MAHPEILLVDDEADILDLGASILREAGYDVASAINSDVALILLEQGLPFRVLVTDVVLPGLLDGFALAHRARQMIPGIPVIYTTGMPAVARVRSRSGAPWGRLLVKPWKTEDLIRMVEGVCRRRD